MQKINIANKYIEVNTPPDEISVQNNIQQFLKCHIDNECSLSIVNKFVILPYKYFMFPLSCQAQDKFCRAYAMHILRTQSDSLYFIERDLKSKNIIFFSGTYLIMTNIFCHNYSHFTLQCFASLLLAVQHGLLSRKTTLILPKMNSFQKELLNLFFRSYGDFQYLEIEKMRKNDIYIFSEAIFFNGIFSNQFNHEMNSCFNKFKQKIIKKTLSPISKKVYISRKDATAGRKPINEDDVITYFKKHGFTSYTLSELSVIEKIKLFDSAEMIAGAHGAGGANVVYANDGIYFYEFFSDTRISDVHAKIALYKDCYYAASVHTTSDQSHSRDSEFYVDLSYSDKTLMNNAKKYSIPQNFKYTCNDYSNFNLSEEIEIISKYISSNFDQLPAINKFILLSKQAHLNNNQELSLQYIYGGLKHDSNNADLIKLLQDSKVNFS